MKTIFVIAMVNTNRYLDKDNGFSFIHGNIPTTPEIEEFDDYGEAEKTLNSIFTLTPGTRYQIEKHYIA